MKLGHEKANRRDRARVVYDPIASFRPRKARRSGPGLKTKRNTLIVDSPFFRATAVWERKPHGSWQCWIASDALAWMVGCDDVVWARAELERRQLKWKWRYGYG